MYTIIDYYTGKDLHGKKYATKKEAIQAKHRHLTQQIADKVIHNNLFIIKTVTYGVRECKQGDLCSRG